MAIITIPTIRGVNWTGVRLPTQSNRARLQWAHRIRNCWQHYSTI